MEYSEIGRMNDFIELGGDSFNAIRVSSINEKRMNFKLNFKDILNYSKK